MFSRCFKFWLYGCALCSVFQTSLSSEIVLNLLHTNDVHARVEQFNRFGTSCSADDDAEGKCFGGVARRKTKVQEIRNAEDNVLLLDAGDQFLGTLWFNEYKGLAASFFMQQIGYDAMCLGNHEFDLGVDALVTFLDNVTFPVLSANTDVPNEPRLQGKFAKSHVFDVGGEKVGVIGFLTTETAFISNGGDTVSFSDVVSTVRTEAERLTSEGINKIIALGHAGYAKDQEVAAIEEVDIVVGGHTNTFLYNGEVPSNEDTQGDYPTVVSKPSGKVGLVVQDFTWGKYLGHLKVAFDAGGNIANYSGNPILLDNSVAEDPTVLAMVNEWKIPIDNLNKEVVGATNVLLDGRRESCRLYECSIGNFFLDAVISYHADYRHPNNSWAPAAIALWNGGGLRASINKGNVTIGQIMNVLPFANEVDLIRIKGSNLRAQLEFAVREWDPVEQNGRFLQFSGLKVVYNLTQPRGERVISVDVRCLECDIPSYSPLVDTAEYNIFTSSFLIRGGDGYTFDHLKLERFNTLESDVMIDYFRKRSPITTGIEGRIQFRNSYDVTSASTTISHAASAVLSILIVHVYRYIL